MMLPAPDDARVALGAALGAFATSGGLDELQASVFESLATNLFLLDTRAEPVEPLDVDAFLRCSDAGLRHQAVCLMTVLEMVATPLLPVAADSVKRYAHRLGVDHGAIRAARARAKGHLRMMHADFERSSWYTRESVRGVLHGQLRELTESKLAYRGVVSSRTIAEKWLALRDCPPGSWGRGVAEFYERHQFPFPGEKHGIYEIGARHDFVHVLAGYDATPEGELDVFGFIAAAMPGDEGLVLLSVTFGLFQNGSIDRVRGKRIAMARTDTLRDAGAIDHFTDALRRGSLCNVDVMSIDQFEHADRQLDDVRHEFNVVDPSTLAV
jgi:hypothetical protein